MKNKKVIIGICFLIILVGFSLYKLQNKELLSKQIDCVEVYGKINSEKENGAKIDNQAIDIKTNRTLYSQKTKSCLELSTRYVSLFEEKSIAGDYNISDLFTGKNYFNLSFTDEKYKKSGQEEFELKLKELKAFGYK